MLRPGRGDFLPSKRAADQYTQQAAERRADKEQHAAAPIEWHFGPIGVLRHALAAHDDEAAVFAQVLRGEQRPGTFKKTSVDFLYQRGHEARVGAAGEELLHHARRLLCGFGKRVEIACLVDSRDDEVRVVCMVKEIPSVRITFDYECYNQENELLNTGTVTLVFVDKERKRPTLPPDFFVEAFEAEFYEKE